MRYIDADLLEPDTEWDDYKDGYMSYSDLQIRCAKTADVRENVRGEWIIEDDIVPITFIDGYVETKRCVCSNCGYKPTYKGRTILPTTKTLLFCPNCGADMKEK